MTPGAHGSALTRNVARFPSGPATQTRPPGLATLLVSTILNEFNEMEKAENQLLVYTWLEELASESNDS